MPAVMAYTHLRFEIAAAAIRMCKPIYLFLSCAADVEGLESAESTLSAPAQNLSNSSDQDGKSTPADPPPDTAETLLPDSTSPGSGEPVAQRER